MQQILLLALFVFANAVQAATLTVTNSNDSGAGSLRQAVADANSGDTIVFNASLIGQTITLTSGQITIGKNLTIDGDVDGDGTPDVTIDGGSVNGTGGSRIFFIVFINSGTVNLNGLTLQNGNTNSGDGGGAIYNNSGKTLNVTNSTLSSNSASNFGGAIYNDSGNTLNVTNSTLSGNSAGLAGGAIFNDEGTVNVTNSAFSGNSAATQFSVAGAIFNDGTLTVTNSTFSGNSASNRGGAIENQGTVMVTNSIIWNNAAPSDPSIANFSTLTRSYSLVQGFDASGTGNLDGNNAANNPLFINALAPGLNGGGDYRLQSGSPALNVGNNLAAPSGNDLAGKPRIQNTTVDLGAYEGGYLLVTSSANDSGTCTGTPSGCTLRQAVADANSGDTIVFNAAMTITLTSEITIAKNLTINGDVDNDGTPDVTISGGGTTRIFTINSGLTVTLNGLTLQNGNTRDRGGAIENFGTLNMTNSTLSGNSAYYGGAIYNDSGNTLNVANSTLSGNFAFSGGGAIYNLGTLNMTNSTLSGNSTSSGGGAIDNRGTLTVTNSTLSGNSADLGGGAIDNGDTMTVTNSTLSGNLAGFGGAIDNAFRTLTMTNSTLSGNSANEGGAIYNYEGTLTVTNSLIWNNRRGSDVGTANSAIESINANITRSYSLIQGFDNTTGTGNLDGAFSNFDQPANANYPMFTTPINLSTATLPTTAGDFILKSTSPAINKGDNNQLDENSVKLDLNGDGDQTDDLGQGKDLAGKDRIQSCAVDLGAYESAVVCNQNPVAKDDIYTTAEDTKLIVAVANGVLTNDTDADVGDTLSVASVEGDDTKVGVEIKLTSGAKLTVNGDGSFVYDPNGAFSTLSPGTTTTDSFTYQAKDDQGGRSSAAKVTISIYAPQTFTVTAINDGTGKNTLRNVIAVANTGDIIDLTQLRGTLNLKSPLEISKDLTLQGPDALTFGISGRNQNAILIVKGGAILTLNDLLLHRGNAGTTDNGGALQVIENSQVVLNRVRLQGNQAANGGAIFIEAGSSVQLINSLVAGNYATTSGSGIANQGNLEVINSHIVFNRADDQGGGIFNDGTLSLANSLIWNNTDATGRSSSTNSTASVQEQQAITSRVNSLVQGLAATGGNLDGLSNTVNYPQLIQMGNSEKATMPSLGGDFRPQASSVLIDNGDNASYDSNFYGTFDLFGRVRVNGTINIGAFEE